MLLIENIHRTLINTSTLGKSGPGSNENKDPELEPHYQMQLSVMPKTDFGNRYYTSTMIVLTDK